MRARSGCCKTVLSGKHRRMDVARGASARVHTLAEGGVFLYDNLKHVRHFENNCLQFLHRNVKLQNILLDDKQRNAKLSGFGQAIEQSHMGLTIEKGPRGYKAPEV